MALEALGIVSLVFSSLFMVELLASVWAFGSEYVLSNQFPKVFVHQPGCNGMSLCNSRFLVFLKRTVSNLDLSYFRSAFHIFDAIVIVVGFVVDVILHGVLEEVASLVVVLRLWRVFKIIEELSVGAEEQMDDMDKRIQTLERENGDLEKRLRELEEGRNTSASEH